MRSSRLDRQLCIEGWNQRALENAKVGVVGDDDLLASLYIMSASALGINNVLVLSPILNAILVETAKKLNPRVIMTHVEGFYTHPVMDEIFKECNLIVDLSHYGLANKLLLEKGYRENIPIIRGLCYEQNNEQGFKTFTYIRGLHVFGVVPIHVFGVVPILAYCVAHGCPDPVAGFAEVGGSR